LSEFTQTEMTHALRDAGYRLTQPRRAILQVLEENEAGLTAEDMHRRGKTLCPKLGLVTVYRTLELLGELGLVRRVHSEQRCHSYVSAGDGHHHLICQVCHRVIEFPCAGLDELLQSVSVRTGYVITGHLLELTGLCPECSAIREQRAGPEEETQ